MPYKDKEKQAESMRKYRTPYMRQYRRFVKFKSAELERALRINEKNMAKWILRVKISSPNLLTGLQTNRDKE